MNHKLVEKAQAYILKNWRKQPGLREIAAHTGVSSFHLHRVFHKQTGVTTKELLTQCQMEEAKRLLGGNKPMSRIATEVGFSNQSHFNNRFKAITGQTPGQYRKLQHGG